MNEITYTRNGDYLIPNIGLPEPSPPLGKYGRMRKNYLREHRPIVYNNLILTGRLFADCAEGEKVAEERIELIVAQLAERRGVTEKLKAEDQMKWVGEMNNIRSAAEEIVLQEVVFA